MSSGSLTAVDKAEKSTEPKTQPPPASVSQTGELPQEIKVRPAPFPTIIRHICQQSHCMRLLGTSDVFIAFLNPRRRALQGRLDCAQRKHARCWDWCRKL